MDSNTRKKNAKRREIKYFHHLSTEILTKSDLEKVECILAKLVAQSYLVDKKELLLREGRVNEKKSASIDYGFDDEADLS